MREMGIAPGILELQEQVPDVPTEAGPEEFLAIASRPAFESAKFLCARLYVKVSSPP
jgi:hypothetical protein